MLEARRWLVAVTAVVLLLAGAGVLFVGVPGDDCGAGSQSPALPEFAFDQTGTTTNATVTVTHNGGEGLDPNRLLVDVDGTDHSWANRTTADGETAEVVAGDSLKLTGLEAGTTITVRYDLPEGVTYPCGDTSRKFGRYEVS